MKLDLVVIICTRNLQSCSILPQPTVPLHVEIQWQL